MRHFQMTVIEQLTRPR